MYVCSYTDTRLTLFATHELRAIWKYIKILLDERSLLDEYDSVMDTFNFLEKRASPFLKSEMQWDTLRFFILQKLTQYLLVPRDMIKVLLNTNSWQNKCPFPL